MKINQRPTEDHAHNWHCTSCDHIVNESEDPRYRLMFIHEIAWQEQRRLIEAQGDRITMLRRQLLTANTKLTGPA